MNDNAPEFITERHIGIPDSSVRGDVVAKIEVGFLSPLTPPFIFRNLTFAKILILKATKIQCSFRYKRNSKKHAFKPKVL